MFRHVVMLRFKPESSREQRDAAVSGMRSLPDKIPQIRRFVLGEDARVDDGTYDLVLVADFDSAEDYAIYRDHPDHRTLIETVTRPITSARAAVEHELP